MKRLVVIGISFFAVGLLVLCSQTTAVGYQTVKANQLVLIKEKISHLRKASLIGIGGFFYFVVALITYLFLFITQGSHMHQREIILYSLLWPFVYLIILLLLYAA
jgi:hypothetical protein